MGDGWRCAAILVVDDDAATRELLNGILEARGHHCTLAEDAAAARAQLADWNFNLVLCDVEMPGECGLDLARHIISEHQETAVLILSSHDEARLSETALEFGAYGYLLKPFRPKELVIAVTAALRRHAEVVAGRRDRVALEREAHDLREAIASFEESSRSADVPVAATIDRLTRAISARSHEAGDHIERVGSYSGVLAKGVGLPPERCRMIRRASSLHDIGKIAVSDHVLLKPGPLTPTERAEMQRHAEVGYYVLAGSEHEVLRLAAEIALTHHERYDGRGYPRRLRGEEIPLEGRIVAIADVFDALTSDRVYRDAFDHEDAVELMADERARHFDPLLLDVFLASLDEVEEVKARTGPPEARRRARVSA